MNQNRIVLKNKIAFDIFDKDTLNILKSDNDSLYGTENEYIFVSGELEIKFGYLLTSAMCEIYNISSDELSNFITGIQEGIMKIKEEHANPFKIIYQLDLGEGEVEIEIWNFDGKKLKFSSTTLDDLAYEYLGEDASDEDIEKFTSNASENFNNGFLEKSLLEALDTLMFSEL